MNSVDTSKAINPMAIVFKLIGKETIWRKVPDSYYKFIDLEVLAYRTN